MLKIGSNFFRNTGKDKIVYISEWIHFIVINSFKI